MTREVEGSLPPPRTQPHQGILSVPWSSFRDCADGEAGPVRVNDWTVLKIKIHSPESKAPLLAKDARNGGRKAVNILSVCSASASTLTIVLELNKQIPV
jgi:hypothetical protein